jgi:hypothetical protein
MESTGYIFSHRSLVCVLGRRQRQPLRDGSRQHLHCGFFSVPRAMHLWQKLGPAASIHACHKNKHARTARTCDRCIQICIHIYIDIHIYIYMRVHLSIPCTQSSGAQKSRTELYCFRADTYEIISLSGYLSLYVCTRFQI